jgi:glucose-1-phosphate thymidylyltransferase
MGSAHRNVPEEIERGEDMMKGILLAGGVGTRLFPATQVISKQLLPVYDKPMIFYPLSVLMLAGIRDILIISTPKDTPLFQELLGNGEQWGINLVYKVQPSPDGLAQAFILGEDFIGDQSVCLILGDNIFFGQGFASLLEKASTQDEGSTIFGYRVRDPERFGVAQIDQRGKVIGLEEKPIEPKSRWAVTGLYMYDNHVIEIAKSLSPSPRGELEITDLNRVYMERDRLHLVQLGRGFAWLDTGTHGSLLSAGQFVATVEERVGMKIACLEEVAYSMGFIDKHQLASTVALYGKSSYGDYIKTILEEE